MLGFLPTRAYRPGTPGATTFLSPLSGTFNYGWDSFEIKRRIRSAGAFPDRASALRLITAVALRTTAVWSERRYLDLSLLKPKEVAKAA